MKDYEDREFVDLLEFGCPVSVEEEELVRLRCLNHSGATQFPEIDSYLDKQVSHGATLGPLDE